MDELAALEYQTLRQTISTRGTARSALFLVGMGVWAVTLLTVLIALPNPVASVIPLLVLVATFEALRGLNSGVERIGRYLQVFHERPIYEGVGLGAPAWEETAMHLAPRAPGAGGHPLFLPIFLMATAANLLAVLFPGPVLVELVAAGMVHLAFVVWILYADREMRQQRARELAAFRALRETRTHDGAGA
jgi:hypothetical protein